MAKQVAEVDVHAIEWDSIKDDTIISVSLIDNNLYLGNMACAHSQSTIQELGITHILTIDVVPLPRTILERPNLIFKYIRMADVPKEDLISNLPSSLAFIEEALTSGGTILVHCYVGMSRSASVVIAYIMKKYGLCFDEARALVRTKRRFVCPNAGFEAQLKLFGHMGCKINKDDPRYKQFRLRMAGQKLRQVKILPQSFCDLVKPDPALVRERPEPCVYRCVRCRRVLAAHSNIIPHLPKPLKMQLAKKGIRPPPSDLTGLTSAENEEILIQKLQILACKCDDVYDTTDYNYTETLIDNSVCGGGAAAIAACQMMWFVEPLAWMSNVTHAAGGKLACPSCNNKIGSFSWVMSCKCPCGQRVAPAFYLVPSKVEKSNIVQNVQTTV